MNKKELECKLIEVTRKYNQLLKQYNGEQEYSKKAIDEEVLLYQNSRITNKTLLQELKRKDNIIKYLKLQMQEKNNEKEKQLERLIKENDQLKLQIEKLKHKYKNKKEKITSSKLRGTKEYKEFRLKILERDNYKCIKCGNTKNLQVHHIKSVKKFPELLMVESNVETLCIKCHSETDNYLKG